jgi:hypothetical protein
MVREGASPAERTRGIMGRDGEQGIVPSGASEGRVGVLLAL